MKAAFLDRSGGEIALRYGERPKPRPQKGEALILVKTCALNRLDLWLKKRKTRLPHIPGSDVCGVIEEINGDSLLEKGQEVVVNPAIPCGSCLRCRENKDCELVNIFGARTQGGYAEYVAAPIRQLYPKPERLSFAEAAAFPLDFLTAWHMLAGRARLQQGETVFIWGASGGLGSSAIRIAKYLGAKTIAAAKSEEIAQKLKEIGADETVIYTKENVAESVKELTDGQGADVVFESVGQKTWSASLSALRPLGRVVIAGTTGGDIGTLNLSDLYYFQHTILGSRMGTKEEFENVLELVKSGKLKPVIDKTFTLREAAAAQKRMEERSHFGKILLETE